MSLQLLERRGSVRHERRLCLRHTVREWEAQVRNQQLTDVWSLHVGGLLNLLHAQNLLLRDQHPVTGLTTTEQVIPE
jgi:hypothetical protein